MKTKSVITLAIVVLLLAGLSFWAINGFSIDVIRFAPWHETIKMGMDIKGGVTVVYEAKEKENVNFDTGIKQVINVIQKRLQEKGYTEAQVLQEGTNRLRVEIPNVDTPDKIFSLIGSPGKLEFRTDTGETVCTGDQITSAYYYGKDPDGSDKYLVMIQFNDEGTKSFADATTKAAAADSYIAIYYDGSEYSKPQVDEAITGGSASISCSTEDAARDMAIILQSGAMPLEIEELNANTVSATLGMQALESSLWACLIGAALVFVFMLVIYRFMGLAADLALYCYMIIFYLFISIFPWMQLTLEGILGVVLSIGMAVDANVVIFERIKEEFKAGKTYEGAVEVGYSKALTAIIDANVTTAIATLVMLFVGPAPIKNFAITLLAGVIISMFTAIVVTRGFLKLFIKMGIVKPAFYGMKGGAVVEK